MIGRGTRIVGLALFVSIGSLTVAAASPARADDGAPGVARVHVLDGDVDIERADAADSVAAVINAPLNVGDHVSTHDDARIEIELGDRTALRVAPDSQLRFTRLDPDATTLQLAAGTVDARLFDGVRAHPEIDVPGVTITPQRSGSYRVTVDDDGNARVTVRSGSASVATDGDRASVGSGTTLVVARGSGDRARLQRVATLASDGFDTWNARRDDAERDVPSYSYLDDRYVGADDLDRYGSWQAVSGYGNVWHPSYASDWAPYTDGRFAWEPYYGWTWVSAEPWGWAPYHYGRWFDAPGVGWCWDPGRTRAVAYQPALVTFFSFGGTGLNLGFGNIGWVPLAPNEAFHPWWGRGFGRGDGERDGYGDRTVVNNTTAITNVTNVTNITNYRNYDAPGGIVALRRENFIAGRFDRRVAVSRETLRDRHPTAIRGVVPAVPTTSNLAYGGRVVARSQPLAPTFSNFEPPATRVASFDAQRDGVRSIAIEQYPERAKAFERDAPVARPPSAAVDRIGTSAVRATDRTVQPVAPHAPASVWDRFGSSKGAPHALTPRTTTVAPRKTTGTQRATTGEPREMTGAPRENADAPRAITPAPHEDSGALHARVTDPWSRFSGASAGSDRRPPARSSTASDPVRPSATSETPRRTDEASHPRGDNSNPTIEALRRADRAPQSAHATPRTYEQSPTRAPHLEARPGPASIEPAPASRSSRMQTTERAPHDMPHGQPHLR